MNHDCGKSSWWCFANSFRNVFQSTVSRISVLIHNLTGLTSEAVVFLKNTAPSIVNENFRPCEKAHGCSTKSKWAHSHYHTKRYSTKSCIKGHSHDSFCAKSFCPTAIHTNVLYSVLCCALCIKTNFRYCKVVHVIWMGEQSDLAVALLHRQSC